MAQPKNKWRTVLISLLLASAVVTAYWHVVDCQFVSYDDIDYVVANKNVTAGLTWNGIKWAFHAPYASNWHPLTWLSHMLDCELFGLVASRHHLTNLLLHVANTLLLFCLLKRMTASLWCSAFIAFAFGLHPLHVQSVAWIAERKDVLSTLFWILTMLAYQRYARRTGAARYLLVVVCFALGLMAKPMLVTLPLVLLLMDYWPLYRFGPPAGKSLGPLYQRAAFGRLILEKIPLFILTVISNIITFFVQRHSGSMESLDKIGASARFSNAAVSYVSYISKTFWPNKLAVLYPHLQDNLPAWQVVVSVLVMAVITVWVLYMARRCRYLPVGWFWYAGTLVPVIGLVQVGSQAMADRYTYVPIIGLFIMVAWGLGELAQRSRVRKIILTAPTIAVILAMIVASRLQVVYWHDSISLFKRAVAVTEGNYIAHYCLTEALRRQGRTEEIIYHNSQALLIKPDYADAHNGLGAGLYDAGRFDEALQHFRKAVELNPQDGSLYINLAVALTQQGQYEEAVKNYKEILRLGSDLPEAQIHKGLANALARCERYDEAIRHYNEYLRLSGDAPETHLPVPKPSQ